jgi:ribonuclease D
VTTTFVVDDEEIPQVVARIREEGRFAFDLEANGMHAFTTRVCFVQIGTPTASYVIDTLAVAPATLTGLFAKEPPYAVVHDVAFDAQLLAAENVHIAHVHDTSVAAQMLGKTKLGLASLLASELGIQLDKAMQEADWGKRPISDAMRQYLDSDVEHLLTLHDLLWGEVEARGLTQHVLVETDYRIANAIALAGELQRTPRFLRVKGSSKLSPEDLTILREIVAVRDDWAKERDVPAGRVINDDTCLELVRHKPTSASAVGKLRGVPFDSRFRRAMADAIVRGQTTGAIDPEAFGLTQPKKPAPAEIARHKRADSLLSAWRKAQAIARGVDAQAVLPGHCLRDIAAANPSTVADLSSIPGLGAFRIADDGAAIIAVCERARREGP